MQNVWRKYGTLIEEEEIRPIVEKENALRKYSQYSRKDKHLANAILSVLKLNQGMRITDIREETSGYLHSSERVCDINMMLRKLIEAGLVVEKNENFTLKYELTSEERLNGYVPESADKQ